MSQNLGSPPFVTQCHTPPPLTCDVIYGWPLRYVQWKWLFIKCKFVMCNLKTTQIIEHFEKGCHLPHLTCSIAICHVVSLFSGITKLSDISITYPKFSVNNLMLKNATYAKLVHISSYITNSFSILPSKSPITDKSQGKNNKYNVVTVLVYSLHSYITKSSMSVWNDQKLLWSWEQPLNSEHDDL